MRMVIAAILLCCAASASSAAACAVSGIETALAAPLGGLKMTERTVSDIQSTEGGVWRIYTKPDGKTHSIIRIDGGESGMGERRLSILGEEAYGIAITRVDYLRHAFIDGAGPNGTAKRTTEFFYFCGGRLLVPAAEYATMDTAAYTETGEEARKALLSDKDVAEFTKGLLRQP